VITAVSQLVLPTPPDSTTQSLIQQSFQRCAFDEPATAALLQVGLQGIPEHEHVTFEDFYAIWNNVPKVRALSAPVVIHNTLCTLCTSKDPSHTSSHRVPRRAFHRTTGRRRSSCASRSARLMWRDAARCRRRTSAA
jgi:hypothetical protein